MRSLFEYGLTMATGYSTFPLRLALVFGVLLSGAGAVVIALALALPSWHSHGDIGEPFIAGVVALLTGVQLLGIGIIGEYLGRLYFRAMGRPQYFVREQVGGRAGAGKRAEAGLAPSANDR